jgi:chitosanase
MKRRNCSPLLIALTSVLLAACGGSAQNDGTAQTLRPMALNMLTTQASSQGAQNLALNAAATASSVWSSSYTAAKAVDGDAGSRWASTAASGQWLQVDLGQASAFDSIVLNEYKSRITAYRIQYSNDGASWSTAYTGAKAAGDSDTVTPVSLGNAVTARYVRLQIDAASDAPTLYEFQVLAASSSSNPHDANFSPETLQFLKTNTGLDGEQWDNIMKLINKPEQDTLEWTKFYGYCENIGDNRGYTMGIFGATTGGPNDTGPDGPALFKEYDAVSGAANPSIEGGLARIGVHGQMSGSILKITDSATTFCNKIKGLQSNANWRTAMWHTFYNVYIKYSLQQAKQRGFQWPLTIGAFVDTALNQGASGDSGSLEGVLSRSGSSSDEKTFMTKFYAERTKIVDTNDYNQAPNGINRVKEWSSLMNMGETDLENADAAVVKVTCWTMH